MNTFPLDTTKVKYVKDNIYHVVVNKDFFCKKYLREFNTSQMQSGLHWNYVTMVRIHS